MKDFNVKFTVRNNRMVAAIFDQYESVAEFCRVCDLPYSPVNSIITMKAAPTNQSGWTKTALDCATALGLQPVDLWPQHMQEVRLKRSGGTMELSADEVKNIIDHNQIDMAESKDLIAKLSCNLTERETKFLTWRLGDGANATLEECGEILGKVTRERVRQIEIKMMRKMRRRAVQLGLNEIFEGQS